MSSTPNPMPRSGSGGGSGSSGEEGARDTAVAKTAGFVVFSGIALSIIRALNPKAHLQPSPSPPPRPSPSPAAAVLPTPPLPPLNDFSQKHSGAGEGSGSSTSSAQTVEILKGDTLWGFSQKYGVPIDVIKEANGLTGDKIYAGKKLFIPSK